MAREEEQVPMEQLPTAYEWFEDQIAGHHQSIVKNGERQIGFLKELSGNLILKLVQDGVRGECEVQVYTRLAELRNHSTVEEESGSSDNNEIIIRKLAPLVPEFHGLTTVCLGNKDREFLKLEDITGHFRQPCIMDIKMGKVTYDPLATAEKAVREMSKYPEQKKLGFRILGYRLHQEGAEVKVANKKWGLSWTSDNIEEEVTNL
ncbi:hypothetical protein L596_005491 [Steinernema carpocapsae]|uniref:Kinase n=1 Tax=Steinernema carpocapsae TaxID=34508 RepID=A0A4U8UZA2_STECR|nr:hypothetical protein L596_005491 [Steinernema carpocapsae]